MNIREKIKDQYILDGFKRFDETITKEYFYGYCRRAYNVFDAKYQLHGKVGLDFYSLAHEYYITLLTNGFRQLEDRPEEMRLSTWMMGGFRFVVLDALKAYQKEFEVMKNSAGDEVLDFVRSSDHEEGMMYQVAEAVASHYHDDRMMQEIAYELFVLGYKQNEVGKQFGMTPSAVNQRYKKMMEEVVTPFVIENYGQGLYLGHMRESLVFSSDEISMPSFSLDTHKCCYSEKPEFNVPEHSINPSRNMHNNRITPAFISSLEPNQVFVFGSNLHGMHAGGAARTAYMRFGAEMGNGVGIQGQSYAIPTMQGGTDTIKPYVDDFIAYAKAHPEKQFLVTPIGCGIAGFEPSDIAPLFSQAVEIDNISLPEAFWDCLE